MWIIPLLFISCYIQNEEDTEATNLSFNMQISDSVLSKASASVYYFVVKMYQDDGKGEYILTFTQEIVVGSSDVMNLGGGGVIFPVIVTDVPPGDYEELQIQYYEPGNYPNIMGYSDGPFTINKGINNTINITMGNY